VKRRETWLYLGRRLRNAVVGSRGYGKGSSVYSVESVVSMSPTISPSHVCGLAMRKMLWRRSIKKWENRVEEVVI